MSEDRGPRPVREIGLICVGVRARDNTDCTLSRVEGGGASLGREAVDGRDAHTQRDDVEGSRGAAVAQPINFDFPDEYSVK